MLGTTEAGDRGAPLEGQAPAGFHSLGAFDSDPWWFEAQAEAVTPEAAHHAGGDAMRRACSESASASSQRCAASDAGGRPPIPMGRPGRSCGRGRGGHLHSVSGRRARPGDRARRITAVAEADRQLVEAALRPLDGAFDDVVTGCGLATAIRRTGASPARVLHVAALGAPLRAAGALGVRSAWLNRRAAPPRSDAPYDFEWRSLEALSAWLAEPVGAAP